MKGKKVTILEMRDKLAPDAPVLHYKAMMLEFEKYKDNLQVALNNRVTGIDKAGVHVLDKDGKEAFYPADTVLLSAGMKARIQEVERLRQTDREFITVGDCIKPGKILQAVSGGYFAGKNA